MKVQNRRQVLPLAGNRGEGSPAVRPRLPNVVALGRSAQDFSGGGVVCVGVFAEVHRKRPAGDSYMQHGRWHDTTHLPFIPNSDKAPVKLSR